MKRLLLAAAAFAFVLLPCSLAAAAEYHVATTGDDAAAGSSDKPWKTIKKAADTLQAGDTVIVHAGVYRERVDPARGGTAASPIAYQAADGEDVSIRGSERVTTWVKEGAVWHADVPNTTFGTFNPYSTTFAGDYLTDGTAYHLGEVYLDGTPYSEVLAVTDTSASKGTWQATVGATDTTITANFGDADPNAAMAEINVRRYAFFPTKVGLNYLTIKGFHLSQAATQWAPPTATPQDGLIGANFGMGWTIENNYISDAKTVCVSGGMPSGDHGQGINESGNHTIRHNTIERCGQAGIAGSHGLVASKLVGNLIQDISTTKNHFAGFEIAGIKVHTAVDVLLEGNVIRRVGPSGVGVWLDWQAQGSRLTRNVIYDLNNNVILLEANHGPTLIDNNILIGSGLADWSEATVVVHNLISAAIGLSLTDGRTPNYFKPHTTDSAGTAMHASTDNKYFNNICVGRGVEGVTQQPGFESDYNVLYQGAVKTTWGDAHSIVDAADAALKTTSLANGVEVTFKTNSAPTDVAAPLITHDLIGVASLTKQGIDNHDGTPITIDHDLVGSARDATHPTAGPLEVLDATTKITVMAGTALMGTGQVPSGGVGSGGTKASGGNGNGNGSGNGNGNGSGNSTGGAAQGGVDGNGNPVGPKAGNGTGPNGEGAASAAAAASNDSGGCGCHVPVRSPALLGTLLTLLTLGSAFLRRGARA
jgi:Right handed beta helix region/Protein of unknown function (DUF1565)